MVLPLGGILWSRFVPSHLAFWAYSSDSALPLRHPHGYAEISQFPPSNLTRAFYRGVCRSILPKAAPAHPCTYTQLPMGMPLCNYYLCAAMYCNCLSVEPLRLAVHGESKQSAPPPSGDELV